MPNPESAGAQQRAWRTGCQPPLTAALRAVGSAWTARMASVIFGWHQPSSRRSGAGLCWFAASTFAPWLSRTWMTVTYRNLVVMDSAREAAVGSAMERCVARFAPARPTTACHPPAGGGFYMGVWLPNAHGSAVIAIRNGAHMVSEETKSTDFTGTSGVGLVHARW